MKHNNICIIGIAEEEEREKGAKGVLEKLLLRTYLTWGRKKSSKSKRHRGLPSDVT